MSEIKEILQSIGYSNISEDSRNYRMKPIYRESSSNTVLSVRKDTGYFIDFSKQISGSFSDLVKISLDLKSQEEAKAWLSNQESFTNTQETTSFKPKIKQQKTFSKESIFTNLIEDNSYWNSRGVSDDTLKVFNGGVIEAGRMSGRYIFPIYNYKKELVGISGRDITPNPSDRRPKWKHLGDKSTWKYPVQVNNKIIRDKQEVILIESIGDMLSMWDAGVKNVIVTFGLQVSSDVLNYLLRVDAKKIFISFNNDENNNSAGNDAALKAERKLTKFFDKRQVKIALPTLKDFGEMDKQQILEWRQKNGS